MRRRDCLTLLLGAALSAGRRLNAAESQLAGRLTATGSDTLAPLCLAWLEQLKAAHPQLSVEMQAGGSATAVKALIEGSTDLGPMSRSMSQAELDAFRARHGFEPTPVLVALDADIVTNMRTLKASEFCCGTLKVSDALKTGELVTRIDIPRIEGATMHYDKFRLRDAIDFAIVSISSMYSVEKGKFTGARIVFGGVAPVPLRAQEVETFLIGKPVTETVAEEAAELAVKDALVMSKNAYKVVELKALLKASILRMKA